MSPVSTENLAALLGSRICHDLISPIGAVNNGLELLSLSGVPDSPEMALVADSAANANARIGLFRLAFGVASKDQITRSDEICNIWPQAMAGRRLDLNWFGPTSLPRPQAQCVTLALLCLDKVLPRGGAIDLRQEDQHWALTASGPALRDMPDQWDIATGIGPASADPDPANIQFLLLPYYLEKQGRHCAVALSDDSVTLRF